MEFLHGPQVFTCPSCGVERTGVRRRCYACTGTRLSPESIERIRRTMTGVRHTPARRQANSDGHRGNVNRFDLGASTRGKPSPFARSIGSTRIENGHLKVKCPDRIWRYEHRVVWEQAHGPIPPGILIHHENHDPFDNRLENLSAVTRSEHHRRHASPDRMRKLQALSVISKARNSGA